MKTKTKKVLSVLLAVIMIVAAVPMTSLAAKTVASGKCGENAKWKLDSEGTLTISGKGVMDIYYYENPAAPWDKYNDSIKKLVIGNGITEVEYITFMYLYELESIELPKTLTYAYGWYAGEPGPVLQPFPQGKNLKSITVDKNNKNYSSVDGILFNKDKTTLIQYPSGKNETAYEVPSTVKEIDHSAFRNAKNLKSVTVSDSVTFIGNGAFSDCTGLKSVKLSKNLKEIFYYAFSDCTSLTEVTIPKGVEQIYKYAFEGCKSLKKVVIPNTVEDIMDGAFFDCKNLKSVKIPKSVKSIGNYNVGAFGYCSSGSSEHSHADVKKVSGFTICGYKNTKAHAYAKDNGFNFIDLATHKHSYTSKVTTKATTKKAGALTYTCKCGESYTKSISKIKSVTLSNDTFTYNGKVKQPTVTVKDSKGNTLKKGTDYTVKYSSGRKNVGKYTVTVTFKGKYSGTKKLTFKIKPKSTSISKLTAGKKQFTATWYKRTEQTSGYQLEYSTSSSMKNASRKTYTTTSKTSRTVTGLKASTKYYVRIRTYKNIKIDGKTYKYYSAWSSVKSVKTK